MAESYDNMPLPRDLRHLRACLVCSMIKTVNMFESQGCDNCEGLLGMRGNPDRVYECTSTNFDGFIGVVVPDESWVCKWQGIKRNKPGLYAVSVSGSLSHEMIADLRAQGFHYRPEMRDRSEAS